MNKGRSIRLVLDSSRAPAWVTASWTFGTEACLEHATVNGKPWLCVTGTTLGLPVERNESRSAGRYSWRGLWDEEDVEMERGSLDGTWVKFNDESDWEGLDAAKA